MLLYCAAEYLCNGEIQEEINDQIKALDKKGIARKNPAKQDSFLHHRIQVSKAMAFGT